MTRFVATDLEGTLSSGEAWRGISEYLKANGRGRDHQMFVVAHLFPYLASKVGIVNKQAFRNQWLADQAVLLKDSTQSELDGLADWVVENELWAKRRVNVLDELTKQHDAGCTIIIASGAYEPIARAFGRRMGMDKLEILSTPLEMRDGRATGKFSGQIGVDALKAQRVRELVGADGTLVAAYGDTAADAHMLEMAQDPVAVSPDPQLLDIAVAKGWRML